MLRRLEPCGLNRHVANYSLRPVMIGKRRSQSLLLRGGEPSKVVLFSASDQQATSVGTALTSSKPPAETVGKFEITLRGVEVLQSVRLGLVPMGKGQAVVVTEVAEGSAAEQLGVRRGQKLNALSDPMRYGTMWNLEDRPSLKFVVDTFKMRRSSPIDLEFEPMMSSEDMDAIFGSTTAARTCDGSGDEAGEEGLTVASGTAAASGGDSGSGSRALDMSPDNALGSLSSIDQLLGSGSGSGSDGENETIGDRLAAKYAAQQRARIAVNEVQKRIDRRKAYMEIDEQRDDTGLLLGLAAAFLLPALIILVIAYFTGY
ncbi:hypothetical protein VaNZ11_011609, partial [Volvox africanus]